MACAKQTTLVQQMLMPYTNGPLRELFGISWVRSLAKLLRFAVTTSPHQPNTTLHSAVTENLINRSTRLRKNIERRLDSPKRRNRCSSRSVNKRGQPRNKSKKPTVLQSRLSAESLYPLRADITEIAKKTYQHIDVCIYAKGLGRSGFTGPNCDCLRHWDPNTEDPRVCQDRFTCTNQYCCYECPRESPCGKQCQNRRFQQGQRADVSVIWVDGKGYGLRANSPLSEGDFISEYTGEVVAEKTYSRRKIQYKREGIQHLYGFKLQENEIVDATKKGNLARFCNHSCDPNCIVESWAVEGQTRLGIFAAQDICAGEELVFNYETKLSICHCGTSKCYSR